MVDCLFQLQTRGFFRRQVLAVARQTLSLVAGEAIDQYITSRLRLLRQQHTIGRIIQRIQARWAWLFLYPCVWGWDGGGMPAPHHAMSGTAS